MRLTQQSQVCRLFFGFLVISAAWTAPLAVTPHSGPGRGTLKSDSDSSKSVSPAANLDLDSTCSQSEPPGQNHPRLESRASSGSGSSKSSNSWSRCLNTFFKGGARQREGDKYSLEEDFFKGVLRGKGTGSSAKKKEEKRNKKGKKQTESADQDPPDHKFAHTGNGILPHDTDFQPSNDPARARRGGRGDPPPVVDTQYLPKMSGGRGERLPAGGPQHAGTVPGGTQPQSGVSINPPSDLSNRLSAVEQLGPTIDFILYGDSGHIDPKSDFEAKRRVHNYVTPDLGRRCDVPDGTKLIFREPFGGTMEDLKRPLQFILSCKGFTHLGRSWRGTVVGDSGPGSQMLPALNRSAKETQKSVPKDSPSTTDKPPPPPPPPPMSKAGGNLGPTGSTSKTGAGPSISETTEVESGHVSSPDQDTKHTGNLPMTPPNPSERGQASTNNTPPSGPSSLKPDGPASPKADGSARSKVDGPASSKEDGPSSSKADGLSNSRTTEVDSVHDSDESISHVEDTRKDKPLKSPTVTQPNPTEPNQAATDPPGPSSSTSNAGGPESISGTDVESVHNGESSTHEDIRKDKPNLPMTQLNPTEHDQAHTGVLPPSGPSSSTSKAGGETTKVVPHQDTKDENLHMTQPNPSEHQAPNHPPPSSKLEAGGYSEVSDYDHADDEWSYDTEDSSQSERGSSHDPDDQVHTQKTSDAPSGAANSGLSTQRLKPNIREGLPGPPSGADLPTTRRTEESTPASNHVNTFA
ncbi:hypothetical protein EV360DRAFT_68911 [Lentinula raphanica]|nr:hypothetical protein EV360DRAFT_68911 [Lentinula raphanica]